MAEGKGRILALDLARTLALLGMVTFHFTYDLDLFGWVPPYTSVTGWFWYHARLTAGAFIFLAGVSLWLSHGAGIRWPAFWHRLGKIVAASLLVTGATALAMPGTPVFYGILQSIAVSSLFGLAFLRLPAWVTLAAAAAIFALPYLFSHPSFGGWLVWTGLADYRPITPDFEPFFPWAAPFLAGIATGRIFTHLGLWEKLRHWPVETPLLRRLAWPGQHTLAIYLVHQPVLIGLVFAATWLSYRL